MADPGYETDDEMADETLLGAWTLLERAARVVVLTGAGISTASGIPDFRGPDGLWTKDPKAELMSDIRHYTADPEVRMLAWQDRLAWADADAKPNAGHLAIVGLERKGVLDTLITQNIDGLHHLAGSDPEKIVEIHGTVRDVVCLSCGERGPAEPVLDRVRAGERDPHCEDCGGILKSAIISFGQLLVQSDLRRSVAAATRCDLLLAVGSKLSVYPVAGLVPLAKENGARVVIVNAEPTEMDGYADVVVRGDITEILHAVIGVEIG